MFGKTQNVHLNIYGEKDEEITSHQRKAFLQFRINMSKIVKEAETEIFKYYLENFEDDRAMQSDSEESGKIDPRMSSIEELRKLVTPTRMLIKYMKMKLEL
ncbi:hypothetical protein QUF99_02520 [Bacillus sp. DX4.1]|uniref:DUF6985 domain-containing protein n=1 Tax=Bacillus sp. DX4.1 TaxID=3055867 RepID=UPI0025A11CDF|nr:hypothetical protein [Bacillus sp. DX4.1]MDM5186324.1 hypothetical protein [Bacillus sp. DX4.1]